MGHTTYEQHFGRSTQNQRNQQQRRRQQQQHNNNNVNVNVNVNDDDNDNDNNNCTFITHKKQPKNNIPQPTKHQQLVNICICTSPLHSAHLSSAFVTDAPTHSRWLKKRHQYIDPLDTFVCVRALVCVDGCVCGREEEWVGVYSCLCVDRRPERHIEETNRDEEERARGPT